MLCVPSGSALLNTVGISSPFILRLFFIFYLVGTENRTGELTFIWHPLYAVSNASLIPYLTFECLLCGRLITWYLKHMLLVLLVPAL